MTGKADHVRQGHDAVRPYLHGPVELPEFASRSFHVARRISDSTIVIEAGGLPPDVKPWLGSVYAYVADVAPRTRAPCRAAPGCWRRSRTSSMASARAVSLTRRATRGGCDMQHPSWPQVHPT